MSEADTVLNTPSPRTVDNLAADLRQLGLTPGTTVIVHSSLSSLGWVCGGPVAVVYALMDVITTAGTLVMPTHTSGYSDPAQWVNPPVPREWWQTIRDTMPAYDPRTTPTGMMGEIVEVFRTCPGVIRSAHPQHSFAAWGRHAEQITANHELDYSLGEGSPLARIYDLDGSVLLLGVGHSNNTSFHLAEYRAPGAEQVEDGAPILENGERIWKTLKNINLDADCFPELGTVFEQVETVKIGKVGSATARLFSQRRAVDFAVRWLDVRRNNVKVDVDRT